MKHQTVIIFNSNRFAVTSSIPGIWVKFGANLAYLFPPVAIFGTLLFGASDLSLCRTMSAPFLLDNTVQPANNLTFSELYKQRQAVVKYRNWCNKNESFTNCPDI